MSETILILAANPKGTPQLRLDQEVREISSGLQKSRFRDHFTLKQAWAVRSSDIRQTMLNIKPSIVHFCGHGDASEGIAFESESGHSQLVDPETLAGFFALFADKVNCVILNSCYSEIQAKAIAQHINYVIGIEGGIENTRAIEFAVALYDALGAGESIEFAYRLACNAAAWPRAKDPSEQAAPVLIKKSFKHEDFWSHFLSGIPPEENLPIVLSAKQGFEWENGEQTMKPGHTALLSYNEVSAFFKLRQRLRNLRERLTLVHGGINDPHGGGIIIPEFDQDGQLIIIGSTHANRFCRYILDSRELPPLPFRFGKSNKEKCIHVYQTEKGEWKDQPLTSYPHRQRESGSESDILREDFGIILRITNPLDAGRRNKILILGGSHGFGTESAVSFVANGRRMERLTDIVQDRDFEALFRTFVVRNHGLRLGILRLAILESGKWNPAPFHSEEESP